MLEELAKDSDDVETVLVNLPVLPSEKADTIYNAMTSGPGRRVYVEARLVLDCCLPVATELERITGDEIDALLGHSRSGIVRAARLVKTFTIAICLWKPLADKESRADTLLKCAKVLKANGALGPWSPLACARDALSAVIGHDVDYSSRSPQLKRIRVV
jgi:hypothetical protein